MTDPIVIIGAGQAAASFIARYLTLQQSVPLLLIGEEAFPPYQRPPLSKKYLLGALARERLFIRPHSWYTEQGVSVRFNTRVESIDADNKRVLTAEGEKIPYSRLLLCTGSRPRILSSANGGNLSGVFSLRSMADIERIKPVFRAGSRLLIIGGGYIGLETAAVARQLGLEVILLEIADRILQRVAAGQTADYFRVLHCNQGVDLRESTQVVRLTERDKKVNGAVLNNGEVIAADLVLVGIGSIPNSEIAEAAGLDCDNGIAVNLDCETSHADIYAAGDCCSFIYNGARTRLESVQNASDQGDLIARVLAGETLQYRPLPWFWSEQYDCRLQIAGLNSGFDQTVCRPGKNKNSQSVWYYRNAQLLAVDAINDPSVYVFGRKMIAAGINPLAEVIADPTIDLKQLAKSAQTGRNTG